VRARKVRPRLARDSSTYTYCSVLPWIQNQVPVSAKGNNYGDGIAPLDSGLVSAADMHNHELQEREEHAHPASNARDPSAEGYIPTANPRIVERESWMDAQSVERERMKDEYERESRGGRSAKNFPGPEIAGAQQVASVRGEDYVPSITTDGNETSRNVKGDRFNMKDKDGTHKHRHKHHHKHHHRHRSPATHDKEIASEPDPRSEEPVRRFLSPPNGHRGEELFSSSENKGLGLGVGDASIGGDANSTHREGSVPSAQQPGLYAAPREGLPSQFPPNVPWYATPAPSQFPPPQMGVPMPGFPWGQQAQQEYGGPPEKPQVHQAFDKHPAQPPPAGPFSHHAGAPSAEQLFERPGQEMRELPMPPTMEYSPRTVPPGVGLPFAPYGPPASEAPQNWGAPAYGFPEGYPGSQWQVPPPPLQAFGNLPPDGHMSNGMDDSGTPRAVEQPMDAIPQEAPQEEDDAKLDSRETADGAETLEALRARMKENAEESRAALDREREARKMSEQRLAALERLAGSGGRKKVCRVPHILPSNRN
jgi:hypothetical protein